jgi:hypothetical protein
MFEDKKHIWEFIVHSLRPELVLEVPGLSIIYCSEVYNVSVFAHFI